MFKFVLRVLLPFLVLSINTGCNADEAVSYSEPVTVDINGNPVVIRDAFRIVSLNGAVTEIIYALNAGGKIVGVDTSSIFPEDTSKLPKIGYQRRVSAEGVLSLKPSLVIATAEAGPPEAISQLRSAGVSVLIVTEKPTIEGAQERIRTVAQALQLEDAGEKLISTMDSDLEKARATLRNTASKPKVLFIYSRGQGNMLVSGTKTAADEMIRLAGGINAVTGYEGFKPLTAEAVVAAAPDIVLLPERGLKSIGGIENLLVLPGLADTPAGKNRRIVTMDDLYLLGFGPRTGQAVKELISLLHPEMKQRQP